MSLNELVDILQQLIENDSDVGEYPVLWQNFHYEIEAVEVKHDVVVFT